MSLTVSVLFAGFVVSSSDSPAFCERAPGAAVRCGCVMPLNYRAFVEDAFARSAAVFSGTVIERDTFHAKIKISRVWKGKLGAEVSMDTGARRTPEGLISMSSCDFSYQRGYEYLIFGYGESLTGIRTGNCGPSSRFSAAEKTIPILDEILKRSK